MKFVHFLLLFIFCKIIVGDLIHDEKFPTTAFKILDDHKTIELSNPFRANAKVKFTYENGGEFTHLEHKTASKWVLRLHNSTHNVVDIHNVTYAADKTTDFAFNWWHSDPNVTLDQEVCFDLDFNNASWFSTYLEKDQPWPLNTGKPFPSALPLATGSNEPNQLGPVVHEVFFNTDGFAIRFIQYSPTLIHRTSSKQLCFTIRPPHERTDRTHFSSLDIDISMSENIQKARLQAVKKYRISKVTPKGAIPDERMFNQTIFNLDTKNLNQAKVIEQAKEIQKHGFKNVQLVLENWEAHLGDLEFDGTRFPDSKALTSELHKLGFIVKLVINSFVSEKSKLFNKHAEFLIHDPANKTHPYTFNWTTHGTGAILNYGPYNDRYWLADHMRDLHKYEGVDSYRFVGGDLGQFGAAESFHSISGYEHYPNDYTKDFASTAERLGSLVEVDAAYHSQYWPISIQMRPIEADWAALKSIIPAASTIGLAGYPFIVAPTFKADSKPSEELYIRWLQLITFFPSMQLSVAPWNVSAKAANLSSHFAALHLEHSQTIISIARDASANGEPLLRPLWYLAADDSRTFTIGDQFAVGNDIIIAPVLVQGQRERSVYLPKGTWLNQHGNSYVGPKEIKVLTPLEELPYFKRKIQ